MLADQLREHELRHNSRSSLNQNYNCSNATESANLFYCTNLKNKRNDSRSKSSGLAQIILRQGITNLNNLI